MIGYLTAVALRLDERGIGVRALRAEEPCGLAGNLTLDTSLGNGSTWTPTRLRWDPDSGWSATLNHPDHEQWGGVVRYLPAQQIVSAPVTVAHFVVALCTDADTMWASASPRQRRRLDRRLLIFQLSQFHGI